VELITPHRTINYHETRKGRPRPGLGCSATDHHQVQCLRRSYDVLLFHAWMPCALEYSKYIPVFSPRTQTSTDFPRDQLSWGPTKLCFDTSPVCHMSFRTETSVSYPRLLHRQMPIGFGDSLQVCDGSCCIIPALRWLLSIVRGI
jgi:hypothetical protein